MTRKPQKNEAPEKPKTVQMNIRIRETTKARLEKFAIDDLRSLADEADILLTEAMDAREDKK